MKKMLIQFFLTMMILADDRQIDVRIKNAVPIVDTINGFYVHGDGFMVENRFLPAGDFLLGETTHFVNLDYNSNFSIIHLPQYNHTGYAGFSRVIEKRLNDN